MAVVKCGLARPIPRPFSNFATGPVGPMLPCYCAAMPRKCISGIEFTDGEASGVRLKPAPGPMFRPDELTSEDTG